MIILLNPKKPKGSDISGFMAKGAAVEDHKTGEIKQYEDSIAKALVKTFEFLEELTPQQAEKYLAEPKVGEFKCEYCDFSTDVKVALAGHMRSHKNEIAKANEPAIDPNKIPVAQTTQVRPPQRQNDPTQNGKDKDGVEWYGEGVQELNKSSMRAMPEAGRGHFRGGSL